jgi:SHS2 domain-containing protein
VKNQNLKFKVLEHTADLKIKAFGKSLAEIFSNMAKAMAEQQALGQQFVAGKAEEIMEIEADDLNSLLVDWLNEILYRAEVNQRIYTDFEILELKNKPPCKIKSRNYGFYLKQKSLEIKAATYHELSIKKIDGQWEAVVIFDI